MIYKFNGKQPKVGKTTYVSDTAIIIGDVKIGERCYVGPGAVIRADYGTIEIGDETAIEEGVIIHVPPDEVCSIGNGVIVGHGAILHSKDIHDSVLIGMGAIVSIHAEIGTESIVAEGTIVKQGQKVPELTVIAGNPAKKVKNISDREMEFSKRGRQVYVELANKYCTLGLERVG